MLVRRVPCEAPMRAGERLAACVRACYDGHITRDSQGGCPCCVTHTRRRERRNATMADETLENEELEGQDDDLVVLTDDDGEEVEFEHLDTIEYEGAQYVVLLPVEADEDEDEEEGDAAGVLILKAEKVEDADSEFSEEYVTIDDDELLDKVFALFCERHGDEYEFED